MASFASSLKDPSLFVEKSYINGQWVSSKSGKTFQVRNPATDEVIGSCPESNTDDLNDAIQTASAAFLTWRAQSGRARGRILRKFSDLIIENKVDIGKVITAENGKANGDAEGEALFSSSFFEWFAEEAPRLYGDVVPHSNSSARTQISSSLSVFAV